MRKKYYQNYSSSSGMSFEAVLTLIFIVLKLCGVIDWSWWWVLSPTWVSLLVIVAIIIYLCVTD